MEERLTVPPEWGDYLPSSIQEAELTVKFEGYLNKERARIREARVMEEKELSPDISYADIEGLRLEARQKLDRQKPLSLGQASRIPGVSPADINVLMVWLSRKEREGK